MKCKENKDLANCHGVSPEINCVNTFFKIICITHTSTEVIYRFLCCFLLSYCFPCQLCLMPNFHHSTRQNLKQTKTMDMGPACKMLFLEKRRRFK